MLPSTRKICHSAFAALSLFFFLFGIDLLMAAYRLKDPFAFIMTFFSASLIILISLSLFAGFLSRIIRKKTSHGKPAPHDDTPL